MNMDPDMRKKNCFIRRIKVGQCDKNDGEKNINNNSEV